MHTKRATTTEHQVQQEVLVISWILFIFFIFVFYLSSVLLFILPSFMCCLVVLLSLIVHVSFLFLSGKTMVPMSVSLRYIHFSISIISYQISFVLMSKFFMLLLFAKSFRRFTVVFSAVEGQVKN